MDFQEAISRKEELHPELRRYVETTSMGMKAIKHPLLIQLFYTPELNALYNEQYKYKCQYVEEKLVKCDYSSYIWLHERPYRLEKFIEISHDLSDDQYWELLGAIWEDSENLWQYKTLPKMLLKSARPGREKMMSEKDREIFSALPENFTVYRGHQGKNRKGFSWSLSYFKARWFAERWSQGGKVDRANVNKKDVFALLTGRGEFEIVVSPDTLVKVKPVKSVELRPVWMQKALLEAEKGYQLSRKTSFHGLWHWEKVEKNALALAKKTPGSDPLVVQLFALLHDCKRENEDEDPLHGHRAADYIKNLHLKISEQQREILMEACRYHNDGQVSTDPTIGVCWDADRLDLTRVGIIPDPQLLSTHAGKTMIWSI